MTYRLFLDDERYPPEGDWKIARSVEEFILLVEHYGMPNRISFDHDLAGQDGIHAAKWLVEQIMDGRIDFGPEFTYTVHSMNPIGAENIRSYMDSFMRSRHG